LSNFAVKLTKKMDHTSDPVYSPNVIEFVAVAHEYCKYLEHTIEIKGDEMLKIMQRIMPLLYLKASLLPALDPYFEEGNEKFVTEDGWRKIFDVLRQKLGTADEFMEVTENKFDEAAIPVRSSMSENMTDIYQDCKDFLLLYQTGTSEVMNDAVWECRNSFEEIWGQKLVNTIRAIHRFLYSGEEIGRVETNEQEHDEERRNTSEWFISKRQQDFRRNDK
jgi:hypothetical protein